MASPNFEQPLGAQAMTEIMTQIMAGQAAEPLIREFLTTLARRGETAEEIAAAVSVLHSHAVSVPLKNSGNLCDTCGTGGDGQGTINVSTLAALVAAAAGARIAKHGNRAASSRCGSADLLEALGVNLAATPAQVARCIDEAGFGFCFAPAFHPAMKAVSAIRKSLGIRTIFNLIGPLANPCPLSYQLVGVSEERLLMPMAEALSRLGIRHGLVVHGADGLDEATTTGPTQAIEVTGASFKSMELTPASLSIPQGKLEELRGGDCTRNVHIAQEILSGTASPARDIIVLNAACALYAADVAGTVLEGLKQARAAIASGAARRVLERVKELSHA